MEHNKIIKEIIRTNTTVFLSDWTLKNYSRTFWMSIYDNTWDKTNISDIRFIISDSITDLLFKRIK